MPNTAHPTTTEPTTDAVTTPASPTTTDTPSAAAPGRKRTRRRGIDRTTATTTADVAAATDAAATPPADTASADMPPADLPAANADAALPPRGGNGAATTDKQDRLWGALRAHPGATAAELTNESRLSRSAVGKLLTAWGQEGSVTSTPGGGTPRAPRRWTAAPSLTAAAADAAAAAADAAADSGTGTGTEEPCAVPVPPAPSGRVSTRNRSGASRLAAGGLRGLVEEFLADHPGEHGPTAIGKALQRSSGAVANACERLVNSGWAERSSDKPKRYRYAGAQAEPTPDGTTTAR